MLGLKTSSSPTSELNEIEPQAKYGSELGLQLATLLSLLEHLQVSLSRHNGVF